MKIAIIGKGRVGAALGLAFAKARHDVVYGVRDPADPKHAGGDIPVSSTHDAAQGAEVVVAAIMWDAVDGFLDEAGDLSGKILIDCINAYDFAGKLTRLIDGNDSAAQLIAARTQAKVVKTLNQVSSSVMAIAHDFALPRTIQFVAADDEAAKATVMALLRDIGFDPRDAGGLEYAGDLESMGRLWIAQAFVHGMDPDTGWALVEAKA